MAFPGQTGLIVPIDVVAFCVGSNDATKATPNMAGATADYSNQVGNKGAYLGSNVTRPFNDPPLQPLEAGVHLHWALPDALTRAEVNKGGTLQFPAAPNRWLISRFIIQSATQVEVARWVVESDILNDTPPKDQTPVTVPVQFMPPEQDYRYLGQWQVFNSKWREPTVPQGQSIKDLTGSELTAVTTGEAGFASFYPNSRSAFGFYDALSAVSQSGVNLMYVVLGWYSDLKNDPLNGGLDLATMEQELGWTFQEKGTQKPDYSVYSGVVQDIAWNPATDYLSGQPIEKPIPATVAVGNSPSEALSAFFANLDPSKDTLFETLLNAFQQGLLSAFQDPQPGQLAQLQEELHRRRFGRAQGGTIWTIVDQEGKTRRNLPLALALAEAVNQLNQIQQEMDLAGDRWKSAQWQTFAWWYRYFEVSKALQPQAEKAIQDQLGELNKVHKALQQLTHEQQSALQQLQGRLGPELRLKQIPAEPFQHPTEPVILLSGDELPVPRRYGGDGRYEESGYLLCRLESQCLTEVTVSGTTLKASQFSGAALPTPNALALYQKVFDALLEESNLLNTQIAALATHGDDSTLEAALRMALAGQPQKVYTFQGTLPSPVAVGWWGPANPWLPLFVAWSLAYEPLFATEQSGKLADYDPLFFSSNFQIDPDTGGAIQYAPDSSSHSIHIDPGKGSFSQSYQGVSVLTASAVDGFNNQLAGYLKDHTDSTLENILKQLESTNILIQALSGLNDQWITRLPGIQLQARVPDKSPLHTLTQKVAADVGNQWIAAPALSGAYNPIRAGWCKLSLTAVGAFGLQREIQCTQPVIAQSLTTLYNKTLEPGIVYLPPRWSSPSRLRFDWIGADGSGLAERNAHPAATPVCGWLLPNHLDGGFFFYNQQGKPLGSLRLNGTEAAVEWQSAPGSQGSQQTIQDFSNPHLQALASYLLQQPAFFKAFSVAINKVQTVCDPLNTPTSRDLAVLIGRPVALVQASLRLEVQGGPRLNQNQATLTVSASQQTDNGASKVTFPVILGDLTNLNDGLMGYFKQAAGQKSYDYSTFYSEGAEASATSGVEQPTATTVVLTPSPQVGAKTPPQDPDTQGLLLLLDPRAAVHATMGILPTAKLTLPADLYAATLSTLEMTFLTAPVLQGAGGLALPTPQESGYQWSWVEEQTGTDPWLVNPGIRPVSGKAVWDYTPQQITEGWLRLNPQLLSFGLQNAQGHATVPEGQTVTLTLVLTNLKGRAITFEPGSLVAEGQHQKGSVFYVHFGGLVDPAAVPNVRFSASGWGFKALNGKPYGNYWAATPTRKAVRLNSGESLSMSLSNVPITKQPGEAQVGFDYYGVNGLNDGVFTALLMVIK